MKYKGTKPYIDAPAAAMTSALKTLGMLIRTQMTPERKIWQANQKLSRIFLPAEQTKDHLREVLMVVVVRPGLQVPYDLAGRLEGKFHDVVASDDQIQTTIRLQKFSRRV